MGKTILVVGSILLLFTLAAPFILAGGASAETVEEAISKATQGTEKGQINLDAPKGYLGIPGGPQLNPIIGLLWAIWVGWIFSTVGAFGGIMAGVGHMTIYGLGNYAKTFKSTAPGLNKLVTDSIRVSNQWLVGLSALVSSINYARQKRLVTALPFCHPAGGFYHGG
jgi:hypothetical protein